MSNYIDICPIVNLKSHRLSIKLHIHCPLLLSLLDGININKKVLMNRTLYFPNALSLSADRLEILHS